MYKRLLPLASPAGAVSTVWEVDEVRPAKLYAKELGAVDAPIPFENVERDGKGHILIPGYLLCAHKAG